MRISDWSSDVCSSDLVAGPPAPAVAGNAPDDGKAGCLGLQRGDHQPDEIGIRKPGREVPRLQRFGQARADAQMHAVDPVLVMKHPSEKFGVRLRQPVIAVRKVRIGCRDRPLRARVKAEDRKGTTLKSRSQCASRIPASDRTKKKKT